MIEGGNHSVLLQELTKQAMQAQTEATGINRGTLSKVGKSMYRVAHSLVPWNNPKTKGEFDEEIAKDSFDRGVLEKTTALFIEHVESHDNFSVVPDDEIINIQTDDNNDYYRVTYNKSAVQFLGKYRNTTNEKAGYYTGENSNYGALVGNKYVPISDLKVLHFEHGDVNQNVRNYGNNVGERYWSDTLVVEKPGKNLGEGGRRKTRRNKRKCGRKSIKMDKKTNTRRRSTKRRSSR